MDSSDSTFRWLRNFLNVRLVGSWHWILISIKFFGKWLDVSQHSRHISLFHLALFTKNTVQLVKDVTLPPRRTSIWHKRVEEHAVDKPLDEVRVTLIAHAKERGLVKGDVGGGVDADDGEAGSVTLEDSDHQTKDDCTKFFVEKGLRFSSAIVSWWIEEGIVSCTQIWNGLNEIVAKKIIRW